MEHHACTNKHCIAADIAWALATPSTLRRHRPQRRRPGAPNISPCSERLPVDSEDPMPHQATAISHHLPKQAQQAPRAEERHWHYGVTVSWTQRPHDSWRRRRASTAISFRSSIPTRFLHLVDSRRLDPRSLLGWPRPRPLFLHHARKGSSKPFASSTPAPATPALEHHTLEHHTLEHHTLDIQIIGSDHRSRSQVEVIGRGHRSKS